MAMGVSRPTGPPHPMHSAEAGALTTKARSPPPRHPACTYPPLSAGWGSFIVAPALPTKRLTAY